MFNIATVPKSARQALSQDGLSLLNPTELTATLELGAAWVPGWNALTPSWGRLPPDQYLKDGGRYRKPAPLLLRCRAGH
jgi:hypothetical protein